MLERLIDWSLGNRLAVLALGALLLVLGVWAAREAPVDVFPDLTAPTVTVMTEAPGLAAEEVERQVTFPVEVAVAGADGVRRVRSQSVPGFSLVWVEFDWGRDIYQARQVVAERLGQVGRLPEGVASPQLGPITSIMGEILYLGVRARAPADLMQAREAADWVIAPQLLAVPGVAQVVSLGGEVRQYQVQVDPERLRALGIGFDAVQAAVAAANRNASGALVERGGQDTLLRFLGRADRLEDLREAVVTVREGVPVRVRHVAEVAMGAALPVGDGGVNGEPGVVLAVAKQPAADTLALTAAIEARLQALAGQLPPGVELVPDLFRQADFIRLAVDNVGKALRDGALFVVVVLFLFLLNVRTTAISLLAIPLSLAAALLALTALGIGVNTMTLGGMTIAIGALVDDAIIFVENIYRRLKENAARAAPLAVREVIARASNEVRGPVVFSTLIIMLVFLPLFFLGGIEGRLLQPLGVAYLVAIAASLLVALTLTPVLAYWLLGRSRAVREPREALPVRALRSAYRPLLGGVLRFAPWVVAGSLLLVVVALVSVAQLGRSFLPEFNEGSLTIEMVAPPGTALAESARLAQVVERDLGALPEVLSVARRTGRAELAEHTQPPHMSELDLRLGPLPQGKEAFLAELRERLARHPGVAFNIGQPISHRIDHMLTGVRANLAVKVFGPSLGELRRLGGEIEQALQAVEGLVDVAVEPQAEVPQWRLRADREALARYGLTVGEVAALVEAAWRGAVVSDVFEGNRRFDLVVRLPETARQDLEGLAGLTLATPTGHTVALRELVEPARERGAGTVWRENAERRLVVSANVAGRDLRGAVEQARAALAQQVTLPEGYRVEFGGQFEAEAQATRTLLMVGGAVLLGMVLLLTLALRSLALALLVMVNVPLALVGGVVAVWWMGGVMTVAALVGFITLFGIAVRNGLLLIARYQTLAAEGRPAAEVVMQGSLERLAPILMTALTAALALIPLALGLGEPGTEIQAPMAWVILGGLLSATALNMAVVPALYYLRAGRGA
ncbi:efflux RND transporter permease subunit [Ectothiorhodospiraceae bacterium 2226]|nr:efflux RND transporter permease subunit [Ectothiorhodospiraceae bacterium 2226]